jgi:hypothetical protein
MDANSQMYVTFPCCPCASPQDHEQGTAPCRSGDHWSYALSQVRKSVFNSTSTSIYSPAQHIYEYEKQLRIQKNEPEQEQELLSKTFGPSTYAFNQEPLSTKDIFSYRQQRSEHLLVRMVHNFSRYEFNHSFVRLAQGMFLVQKWEFSDPVDFPPSTALGNALDYFALENTSTPIETFSFNDLFNEMMQQTRQQQELKQQQQTDERSFIPYTYTLGIRFTNPYNNMRDVLVRGKIPLWCQTLFITECMRFLPIAPGSTVKGLLPFAKDIQFKFTTVPIIQSSSNAKVVEPFPELIVLFERFAMEVTDPQMMLDNADVYGHTWEERQNVILGGVLFCDIPDETALMITTLANEWATAQGLSLQ